MFRTTYVPAAATAPKRQAAHDTLEAALDAWLADCRAMPERSGDRADLIDLEGGEHLRWVAGAEGGFASGALADAVAEDLDEVTPRQIAAAVRSLLAPVSTSMRIAHPGHIAEAPAGRPTGMRIR